MGGSDWGMEGCFATWHARFEDVRLISFRACLASELVADLRDQSLHHRAPHRAAMWYVTANEPSLHSTAAIPPHLALHRDTCRAGCLGDFWLCSCATESQSQMACREKLAESTAHWPRAIPASGLQHDPNSTRFRQVLAGEAHL